jgi:acyl-CoA reductase-like NAD-dependent aldehyde dehydrogenase
VFDGVTPEMTIAREEIFGPVLGGDRVWPTSTRRSRAPTTRATASPRRCGPGHQEGALRRAQAAGGTVWINTYNVYDTAAPFGGYKQSGFGREMSMHALEHYTQVRASG